MERGHRVDYATAAEFCESVTGAGARWVALPAQEPFRPPAQVGPDQVHQPWSSTRTRIRIFSGDGITVRRSAPTRTTRQKMPSGFNALESYLGHDKAGSATSRAGEARLHQVDGIAVPQVHRLDPPPTNQVHRPFSSLMSALRGMSAAWHAGQPSPPVAWTAHPRGGPGATRGCGYWETNSSRIPPTALRAWPRGVGLETTPRVPGVGDMIGVVLSRWRDASNRRTTILGR